MRSQSRHIRAAVCLLLTALSAGLLGGAASEGEDALKAKVEQGRGLLLAADKRDEGVALLEEAAAELQVLAKKDPADHKRRFLLGRTLFYLERDDEALRAFDQALALAPQEAEYHFMKGVLLRYLDKSDEAAAELSRATELEPGKAKYWFELGEVRLDQERYDEALACYKKTSDLNPDDAQALFKMGLAYYRKGDDDEAVTMWRRALEVRGDCRDAYYNTGLIYQKRGEWQLARESFEALLRLAPGDWHARAKLVQLYQALGEPEKRDAERAALFDLRRQGKVKSLQTAAAFCRDQFVVNERKVMAFEHFELIGDWALRYNFKVLDEAGDKVDYRVSLGSYPRTNDVFRATGKITGDQRAFHLDGYFAGGEHRTYGFFLQEPSYDAIKQMVVKVIKGEVRAISGFKPKEGGDSEIWIEDPGTPEP